MNRKGILVAVQFPANTGYAIGPLERVFYDMAVALTGDPSQVHFSYTQLDAEPPRPLPRGFGNVVAYDVRDRDPAAHRNMADYIRENDIGMLFGFDCPVQAPSYRYLRRAGVHTVVSYWGAPMSGPNQGLKLLAKRLEVALRRDRPDHHVFESEAMRRLATHGRGIRRADTSVVPLAVDPERHRPAAAVDCYAHDAFDIPRDRKIVLYSGHMSPRKGVDVILDAAVRLVEREGRRDLHFLLLGNRGAEAERFGSIYRGTAAESHITFGGYRDDIARIQRSAYLGAIASTGWDSYTLSSVEMAASGLPLIVSRLQGLAEAVDDGRTGYTFAPGDSDALATRIAELADAPAVREAMGRAARARVLERHTRDAQVRRLVAIVRRQLARNRPADAPARDTPVRTLLLGRFAGRPLVELVASLVAASLIDTGL